ncbi:hypothetical protein GCM10011341_28220 [Frigidibacter albus]|nr:hypothetical protein GCM10011341_28220 [Frigidibacter albus]
MPQQAWSKISRQELDFTYGGDGLCDPEVFSAAEAGLPLNGLWTLTVIRGMSCRAAPGRSARRSRAR